MARKVRVEAFDGLYHVINRGNYRAHVFETDGAKASFMKALDEACDRFGWELSAYCIMGNHYHLCLGTPLGNLSDGMRWLQATFAMRFNRYRKEHGHLFQGRFKSLLVEPGKHWLDLVDYIHLNPVRAGLVDIAAAGKYSWSSLNQFPKRKTRAKYLDCRWMDYAEGLEDSKGGWSRYATRLRLLNTDDPAEIESLNERMCKGWCLGSDKFAKDVAKEYAKDRELVRVEREDLAALNRSRWEQALELCLRELGKRSADIATDRLSADWKLAVAAKLRRDSSVTNRWLGESLNMGKPRSVSAICGRYAGERESNCSFAKKLRKLTIDH